MKVSLLLFALVGLSCGSEESQYGPKDPILGQECSPPFGYTRNICGPQAVINRESTSIPDFLYGPNTCRVTEEFLSGEFVYKFNNYCGYITTGYRYWYYYYQCTPFCSPTSTCSDLVLDRVRQRHNVECCDGFTPRKPSEDETPQFEYLYDQYYTSLQSSIPEGCPVAVAPDIADCLTLQGLTTFLELYNISGMVNMSETAADIINSTKSPLTFFVPTNEALESFQSDNQSDNLDIDMLLLNHIVLGRVSLSSLTFNRRFMTLSGLMIHSTAVVFADRSLVEYSQGYNNYNTHSNPIRYTNVRFINGARVVNPDACMSTNITLHIIDRVLMPVERTLAQILRSRPELSNFTEALLFANILGFLNKTDVSRTVFAPTNDAFNEQIPPELFTCLMYMRKPLQDIVLFHIAKSTEYTSSLAISSGVFTLLPNAAFRLSQEDGNVTILTDPQASIVEPDITASNGVLQVIDKVLIPPNFDAGGCSDLVPINAPQTSTVMVTPTMTTSEMPNPTDSFSSSMASMEVDDMVESPLSSLGNVEKNP